MKKFDKHRFNRHRFKKPKFMDGQRFGDHHFKRRPINVLASVITTLSLYLGLTSVFFSIRGEYEKAAYVILGAIVCDMLDGTVARLTNTQSEFGKELDSLCDLVSFGVAPAVLIFCAFCNEDPGSMGLGNRIGGVTAIIFVICGALRLARFNVYQSTQREHFTGLPIPAAGGTVATFVLFTHYYNLHVAFWFLCPLTLLLAYLMVSTVRYPKDRLKKALVLSPNNAFRLLVFFVIAFAVLHFCVTVSPVIIMFPLAAAYMLYGIYDEIWGRVRGRAQTPAFAMVAPEHEDTPEETSSDPEEPSIEPTEESGIQEEPSEPEEEPEEPEKKYEPR